MARPARSGQTRSRSRAGRAGPFGLGRGPPGPVHHCQASYARFANSQGFKPFPIQFEALAQFIAASAEETSMETTKSYIGHLRSYQINKGYAADVFNDEGIKRILRGMAHKYG